MVHNTVPCQHCPGKVLIRPSQYPGKIPQPGDEMVAEMHVSVSRILYIQSKVPSSLSFLSPKTQRTSWAQYYLSQISPLI